MSVPPERPSEPDVSVVVPAYDAQATLAACLAGLTAQTLPRDRYEIVVVDNNSRDASAAIARDVAGVTVVEEPRQGAYAARNRGLHASRGRVVAFTDPDCVPDAGWLETAHAALTAGVRIVVGDTVPAGTSRALELLSVYARIRDEYIFAGDDAALYYGRTNNMAVLRSVFDEVGPFVDRPRGADALLVRAAVARFGPEAVRFEPRMRVEHLELTDLGAYLRKVHVYGYVHHSLRDAAPTRKLTTAEWRRLLREVGRRADATAVPALVALNAATRTSWRLGSWRAAAGLRAPHGVAPAGPRGRG